MSDTTTHSVRAELGVRVETLPYVFAHGREPRGRGYWAFQLDADPEPFWATGTYATCRDDARRLAVSRGAAVVRVLP